MLISNAWAQATTSAPNAAAADPLGGLMGMLPIILMFIVLWFIMIRPQMKKAKEQRAMIEALQKGDEVVTNGGMAGRITKVGDNFLTIEVAANVEIAIQKGAVASILPKGTLKAI